LSRGTLTRKPEQKAGASVQLQSTNAQTPLKTEECPTGNAVPFVAVILNATAFPTKSHTRVFMAVVNGDSYVGAIALDMGGESKVTRSFVAW
jgi:hypothetical protein